MLPPPPAHPPTLRRRCIIAGNVFATDAILAHLMASPRTALPWDIVATYLPGGVIFLDVRDPVTFEMATVNENANHPAAEPKEPGDINGTAEVALEASVINQSISQVVRACLRVCGGARGAATRRREGWRARIRTRRVLRARPLRSSHSRGKPGSQHPAPIPVGRA